MAAVNYGVSKAARARAEKLLDDYFANIGPQSLHVRTLRHAQTMSALGQKQTFAVQNVMSALTPKADMCSAIAHVRFVPIADIAPSHSINSSARPISVFGTLRPSALAVLRLIARLYFVGACTGRSAGFSPFRMWST